MLLKNVPIEIWFTVAFYSYFHFIITNSSGNHCVLQVYEKLSTLSSCSIHLMHSDGCQSQVWCIMFTTNKRKRNTIVTVQSKYASIKIRNINMLCFIYKAGIFPQDIRFTSHLSSYSFPILVMTFTVETLVDWLVFHSAVSVFVSAAKSHTSVLIDWIQQAE